MTDKLDARPGEPATFDQMSAAEITALAHLYRAEVSRSTAWRTRLDTTTNWAVVTLGIALSIAFAAPEASPLPLVLVGILIIFFLMLEARRYRFFYVWRFRARVLEIAFYVPMLRGEGAKIPLDRGTALSDDYEKPQYRIPMIRAIGRRLRRNYGWIFAIQGAAYYAKIAMHPTDVDNFAHFMRRAHIGPIPGSLALLAGLAFHASWIYVAWKTWWDERYDKTKMADFLASRADVNFRPPTKGISPMSGD